MNAQKNRRLLHPRMTALINRTGQGRGLTIKRGTPLAGNCKHTSLRPCSRQCLLATTSTTGDGDHLEAKPVDRSTTPPAAHCTLHAASIGEPGHCRCLHQATRHQRDRYR